MTQKLDFAGRSSPGPARRALYRHVTHTVLRSDGGNLLWSSSMEGKQLSFTFMDYGRWVVALRQLARFRQQYFMPGYDFNACCRPHDRDGRRFLGTITVTPVAREVYQARVAKALDTGEIRIPTYTLLDRLRLRCCFWLNHELLRRSLAHVWPENVPNMVKRLIDSAHNDDFGLAIRVIDAHQVQLRVKSLDQLLELEHRFHRLRYQGDDLVACHFLVAVRDETRLILTLRYPTLLELNADQIKQKIAPSTS